MYTIVDIETTGGGREGNRITEIAIYKIDNGTICDQFVSLVNPEAFIPSYITGLTGITNEMVASAPRFEELAETILNFTKDCVFVAHSINFDYPIVKKAFREAGITFVRKKLCTVRLSRKLFPGFRSYSLGKLCTSLGIPLKDRHRASGDAHATALLFLKILDHEAGPDHIRTFLNARSQEATLPPSLDRETYENLPTGPGVYYFKNRLGEIIYVGKAINIRKRVLGHFYDKSDREIRMCRETQYIESECSGSELLALLMESASIKKHFPLYNRAQKNIRPQYGLFEYQDRNGIIHLALNKMKKGQIALKTFFNLSDARFFVEQLCTSHKLCPKFCHLQEQVPQCSHFRVPRCEGICRGEEGVQNYNLKVKTAIASLSEAAEDYLILEKGRTPDEKAVIWVCAGIYKGYSFVPDDVSIASAQDLEAFWIPQRNTPETHSILQSYMIKNPDKLVKAELSRPFMTGSSELF